MKTIFKWSMTALIVATTLALVGCGGGGGNADAGGGAAASLCAGNSDTFICEVYKVVNNLTSETSDPIATDGITVTVPDDTEPSTKI